jgi:hypothetical protein
VVERREHSARVRIVRRRPRYHAVFHVVRVFILSCGCSWNWNRAHAGFVPHHPRPETDYFTLVRSKSRGRPYFECKLKSSLTFSNNRHRKTLKLCLENGRFPDAERDWQGYDSGETLSKGSFFPEELIQSLDLAPLIQGVARHAGTRRGHQALLSLVSENYDKTPKLANFEMRQSSNDPSRARRARFQKEQPPPISSTTNSRNTNDSGATRQLVEVSPIANSKDAAQKEYDYVEQATLSILSSSSSSSGTLPNVTLPPIYGANSGPQDISTIVETDDDEWLRLPGQVWTLEHILQAEMIMDKLTQVKKWGTRDSTQTWTPLLSQLGCMIDVEDVLSPMYKEVAGRVEIVRVRSITDPTGKSVRSSVLSLEMKLSCAHVPEMGAAYHSWFELIPIVFASRHFRSVSRLTNFLF